VFVILAIMVTIASFNAPVMETVLVIDAFVNPVSWVLIATQNVQVTAGVLIQTAAVMSVGKEITAKYENVRMTVPVTEYAMEHF
jgi:hypothetical protein